MSETGSVGLAETQLFFMPNQVFRKENCIPALNLYMSLCFLTFHMNRDSTLQTQTGTSGNDVDPNKTR